jgi:phosphonate transport system permease protein
MALWLVVLTSRLLEQRRTWRWDINIREATVLGLVGAGGIGANLEASMNLLAWPQVAVILTVILATVIFSEWLSAAIRQSLI